MEQFRGLDKHQLIGIDTTVFIYHLEAHPIYLPLTTYLLNQVQAGKVKAVTSTVTLMELTVHPWKKGREDVARRFEAVLMHLPNLTILPVNRHIARKAAQLQAKLHFSPTKALQIGTALTHGATAWVSNDMRHLQVTEMVQIFLLNHQLMERRD